MKENSISQAGTPSSTPSQYRPNPPSRILVVDDDHHNCHLSAKVLSRHGYQVDAVADGTAGWEALNADSYDLLIAGNTMPKLTGAKLLGKLRAASMAVPVIMVTGMLPARELARTPWRPRAATLPEPYPIKKLLEVVKEALGATGGAREQITPPPEWQTRPSADGMRL